MEHKGGKRDVTTIFKGIQVMYHASCPVHSLAATFPAGLAGHTPVPSPLPAYVRHF